MLDKIKTKFCFEVFPFLFSLLFSLFFLLNLLMIVFIKTDDIVNGPARFSSGERPGQYGWKPGRAQRTSGSGVR